MRESQGDACVTGRVRLLARRCAGIVLLAWAAGCDAADPGRFRAVAAGPIKPVPAIPPMVQTLAPAETPIDLRGQRTAHLTAGQVAAAAAALNAGEIVLAQVALPRAATQEARSFAGVMVRDHGQALRQVSAAGDSAGGAAEPTAVLEHTERSSQQMMSDLQPLRGLAFDRAYIDGQIQMHQAALDPRPPCR